MADYGVNIAVAVKNSQAVTQLSNKLKDTAAKIEHINTHFNTFANMTGKVLPGSIANFNKTLNDAKNNLNNVALNTQEAADAAKEFFEAQNQANRALKEQQRLLRTARLAGETVSATPFGPQPTAGFTAEKGRSLVQAKLLSIQTQEEAKAAAKIFQAKSDFADKIHRITIDLDRKARNAEIDNIIEKFRIENELQDTIFKKAIEMDKKDGQRFMQQLGFQKGEELKAIAEVDKARKKAASEAIRLTGQTSPIGGAVGIPGSPAALRAAERAQRLRSASSSALIGGAFPLLFGQGLGAAGGGLVGGFGGGIIGGEFGFGLSLIGTQVGSIFDQLASKAVDLGAALNPLTADIEAVVTAAGESDTEFQKLLAAYEDQAGAQEALEFATNRLATVVGIEGVNSLNDFNSDMVRAGSEFNKFTSIVLAGIANLINQTGIFQKFIDLGERSRLLISAKRSNDPEIQRLLKERAQAQSKENPFLAEFFPVLAAQQIQNTKDIGDEIISLQRVNEEKELGLQQSDLEAKVSEKRLNALKGSRQELKAQNTILKNNGDILKQEVFDAEKLLINEKMLAEVDRILKNQKEAKVKSSPAVIEEQLAQAVLNKENELLKLTNRRKNAQEAADRKEAAASKKRQDELDRLEAKKQKGIERAIKGIDRELESADKAFKRASSQLDAITQKHEDKMAFEREYSRLIQEGSTPAAAKQAIELQKQLLELDRSFDKQEQLLKQDVQRVKLAIEKARAEGATTAELQAQLDRLKDIENEIAKLPGKKGKAKGAIEEDLAPETGADKIQAEMDRVKGALNELIDPANQVILAAQAIGDAFSESFKGLIRGSMSAQEALANLFSRTADHFADMAAQMIAKQIQMKILGIALNFFQPAASAGAFSRAPSDAAKSAAAKVFSQPAEPFRLGAFAEGGYAQGGYVSGPTRALIGEGGQPEYVIPASKMTEAMGRYARGARGAAVIPEGDGMSTEGGMNGISGVVDVRYSVERINNVDYVTAAEFERGMNQAAKRGAELGRQGVYSDLVNKRSIRSRVGV